MFDTPHLRLQCAAGSRARHWCIGAFLGKPTQEPNRANYQVKIGCPACAEKLISRFCHEMCTLPCKQSKALQRCAQQRLDTPSSTPRLCADTALTHKTRTCFCVCVCVLQGISTQVVVNEARMPLAKKQLVLPCSALMPSRLGGKCRRTSCDVLHTKKLKAISMFS